jgi:gamma-glutamylputrescine oxidase
MRQRVGYDDEVRGFSPPSCPNANLTCQLLVVGGGLSGLSAAEAAVTRGLDVIVIEKGVFGREAASGLNAGQFLTGWAKPIETMLAELARQEQDRGLSAGQAQSNARRRVRAFLRRTIEGCQRIAQLDRDYNLRASVRHGATVAAMNDADMAGLESAYKFMEDANFRALMPVVGMRHAPFFQVHSARELQKACGTAEDVYAGGVTDFFGGSFHPRKLLNGLARSLQNKGVRFFQETEAQALDFSDHRVAVFCENGAAIQADQVFMANAYARHINGDALERAIFLYDYVVVVELPERSNVLTGTTVLSDTRDPCFYARRQRRRLYMGYAETAESSPEITREVARQTLEEAKRIFPSLRVLGEQDIASAWSGRVFYTSDDYPFVERRSDGRVTTFAAPSDHGNSLAAKVGQMVGDLAALTIVTPATDEGKRNRLRVRRQLKLFEGFPKGLRLRPGMRYQEAAAAEMLEPLGDEDSSSSL